MERLLLHSDLLPLHPCLQCAKSTPLLSAARGQTGTLSPWRLFTSYQPHPILLRQWLPLLWPTFSCYQNSPLNDSITSSQWLAVSKTTQIARLMCFSWSEHEKLWMQDRIIWFNLFDIQPVLIISPNPYIIMMQLWSRYIWYAPANITQCCYCVSVFVESILLILPPAARISLNEQTGDKMDFSQTVEEISLTFCWAGWEIQYRKTKVITF